MAHRHSNELVIEKTSEEVVAGVRRYYRHEFTSLTVVRQCFRVDKDNIETVHTDVTNVLVNANALLKRGSNGKYIVLSSAISSNKAKDKFIEISLHCAKLAENGAGEKLAAFASECRRRYEIPMDGETTLDGINRV